MKTHWICPQCRYQNATQVNTCQRCGTRQLSSLRDKKERNRIIGILIIIGILAILTGQILVQYLIDRSNYTKGHAAYQAANCDTATQHFDAIIADNRLGNLGNFVVQAEIEKTECNSFQIADDFILGGQYSTAVMKHYQFIQDFKQSQLVNFSRERIKLMFSGISSDQLVSMDFCSIIDNFQEDSLISQPEFFIPPLLHDCGKIYIHSGDHETAFAFQKRLLVEYSDHEIADSGATEMLENPYACEQILTIKALAPIANRPNFMPNLYFNCGKRYEADGKFEQALEMYTNLITEFSGHFLAQAAEDAIFSYQDACNDLNILEESALAEDSEFRVRLYYQCGVYYQNNQDYSTAIRLFEKFLTESPLHELAAEVEASLADSIIENTKETAVAEIPQPQRSGTTNQGATLVIIQNDSPEKMRIVFSGPESRIEELAACSTCQKYQNLGPTYCPEKGPIGQYSLTPGTYDIVVETSDESRVTPYSGSWKLITGDEYYNCFFIVTTSLIPSLLPTLPVLPTITVP